MRQAFVEHVFVYGHEPRHPLVVIGAHSSKVLWNDDGHGCARVGTKGRWDEARRGWAIPSQNELRMWCWGWSCTGGSGQDGHGKRDRDMKAHSNVLERPTRRARSVLPGDAGGRAGSRNPSHTSLASRWAPRPERRGGRAPEATGNAHGAMWFRVLTHPAVQCWHRQLPEAPPQFASTVVGVVCQRSGVPRRSQ